MSTQQLRELIDSVYHGRLKEHKKLYLIQRLSYNDINNLSNKQIKRLISSILFENSSKSIYGKNFWMCLGYSDTEASSKVREIQKKNSDRVRDKRYSDPEWYQTNVNNLSVKFWINKGLTEEQAKDKIKKRQKTFSLDICIEKYGIEEGRKRFEARQKKWIESIYANNDIEALNKRKGLSREQSILKHGIDKTNSIMRSRFGGGGYSRECTAILEKVKDYCIDVLHISDSCLMYAENELGLTHDNTTYFYDFAIKNSDKIDNLIIEYHGVRWHPKNKIDEWSGPFGGDRDSSYDRDQLKKTLAIDSGYYFMSIFSDETYIYDRMINFIKVIHEKSTNKNREPV